MIERYNIYFIIGTKENKVEVLENSDGDARVT